MTDKTITEMATIDLKQIAVRVKNLTNELSSGSLSSSDKNVLSKKVNELILRLEGLKS